MGGCPKKMGENVKILHTNSIKALNSSEMNLLVVATSDPVNKKLNFSYFKNILKIFFSSSKTE